MTQFSPAALIDGAWSAALDPARWEDWARDVMRGLDGSDGMFGVIDDTTGTIRHAIDLTPRAGRLEDYLSGWHLADPQLPQVMRMRRSGFFLTDHADPASEPVSEFRRWQRGWGVDHHLTAVVTLPGTGQRILFPIARAPGTGPTSAATQRRMARLLPQVARAMRLGFEHEAKRQDAFWEGSLARAGNEAVLLLDEHGRMLRATDAALSLLGAGDGLSLANGRLVAAMPACAAGLDAMVAAVTRADSPRSGAVQVRRAGGRIPYLVVAYPVVRNARMLFAAEAAALVSLIDRSRGGDVPRHLIEQAFGLTRREAELASLLCHHHSLESAAASMLVALPTARVHLGRILAKTGTSRQAELVALLAGLRA